MGVLSLEDVLEELVGDIEDETDLKREEVVVIAEDEVSVTVDADALDVNKALNVALPDMRIGELLLEELGRIPQEGETFIFYGVLFTIAEATPRMIQRVHLRRLDDEEQAFSVQ